MVLKNEIRDFSTQRCYVGYTTDPVAHECVGGGDETADTDTAPRVSPRQGSEQPLAGTICIMYLLLILPHFRL